MLIDMLIKEQSIFFLLLEILLAIQCGGEGVEILYDTELQVDTGPEIIDTSYMNLSGEQMAELEWGFERDQLINDSMLNITWPSGINLGNQNKTVNNYTMPLPVYVAVPVMTVLISACLIYGFCWWKMRLVKRRKALLEKQNLRRRRSSLKPGSSERGKKFGLTRAIGPDGDPLIIPKDKVLSLARKLDDVEQQVLSYQSLDMGDRFPEKHEYKVKEEAYSIAVNPMYSTLQSGAMGYVLGGHEKALLPRSIKPDKSSDPQDYSDQDATSRRKKSSINNIALPRLSKLSPDLNFKGDNIQRGSATRKSLINQLQKEAKEEEESSVDTSSFESEVSSPTSLETESEEESSEHESDDESVKTPLSTNIHTVPRLSSAKSASEVSPPRASLSPKPFAAGNQLSSALPRFPKPSVVSPEMKMPVHSKVSKPTVSVEESVDAESNEEPRTTKSPASRQKSAKASLSPNFPKAGESNKERRTSKATYARDEESPKRLPRASSAQQASQVPADSGDITQRSNSASRASKAAVAEEYSLAGNMNASTSSPRKSLRNSNVNSRFSDGTSSRKDIKDSSKKLNWDPNTIPARPSIKKSGSSNNPGTSPR